MQLHSATTAAGPDEGMTSGSLSVQDSGGALRHACAEVRGMALQRAAYEYLQAAVEGDTVEIGTWLVASVSIIFI